MVLTRPRCVLPIVILSALSLGPSPVSAQTPDAGALRFTSGTSAKIPIEIAGGMVLLQARVNGSAPEWLVFDTGATINVLDEAFAKRIGLDLSDRSRDERSGRERVKAHGLTLGFPGVELTGQTATVMNITDLALFMGHPLVGIFGYELLRRAVVDLDYAGKTLVVHQPGTFTYTGPGTKLPLEVVGKWPVLPVRLEQQGRPPVDNRLILDSGSMSAVSLMTGSLAADTIDVPVSAGIGGVGAGNARAGRISALSVGPWTFKNPVAMLPPADAEEDPGYLAKAISSTGVGLFGAPVCGRFRLIFDYADRSLIMEPGAGLDAPFEFDMSGVILMSAGLDFKAFRVIAVIGNSPAAQAGLQAGDTITAVNGRDAAEIQLSEVRAMFQKDGVRYTLRVQRASGPVETSLVTRRLI